MLNRSASLAMSTCVLKALPGKLDIKRHSPSILYIFVVGLTMNLPYGIVYEITQVADSNRSVHPFSLKQSEELGNNSSESLGSRAMNAGYRRKCSADKGSMFHFENWYHIWLMDVLLIFIIPFTLMTGSNLVVVYFLIARKTSMVTKLDSKIRAVTIRAVAISVMHCLASGSFTMSTLFPEFLDKAFNVKHSNEYYGYHITLLLAYINHAVNFLLFSFLGTDFRRDCADFYHRKALIVRPEGVSQQQSKSRGDGQSQSLGDNRTGAKTGQTIVSAVSAS